MVPPVCRDDNFLPTTSPPLLRNATSPCRKDSLRPEGDVANSDRGRMTTGESVMVVLDEQSFCFRKRPGSAVEIYSSNTNAATNADRARRPAPNRAQANSRACPACQGLPYQGSWHRFAMPERLYEGQLLRQRLRDAVSSRGRAVGNDREVVPHAAFPFRFTAIGR